MDKQDRLFLNIVNSLTTDLKPFPSLIIIFEHFASIIDFVPSVKNAIYRIEDKRLDDRKEWQNYDTYPKIYIQNIDKAVSTGKRIIQMNYNLATAVMTKDFIDLYEEDNSDKILCLSFFHDDEETYHTHIDGIENLLDYKLNLILSMIDYPFIKKIIVPFNFKINVNFLADLLNDNTVYT